MTINALTSIVGTLSTILVFAWAVIGTLQRQLVSGSHKKYMLTTLLIIITASALVLDLLNAVLRLMDMQYMQAGTWTASALLLAVLSRRFFHDDNWFNSQFKKLKNGLKNLGSRLSRIRITFPSPLPVPA